MKFALSILAFFPAAVSGVSISTTSAVALRGSSNSNVNVYGDDDGGDKKNILGVLVPEDDSDDYIVEHEETIAEQFIAYVEEFLDASGISSGNGNTNPVLDVHVPEDSDDYKVEEMDMDMDMDMDWEEKTNNIRNALLDKFKDTVDRYGVHEKKAAAVIAIPKGSTSTTPSFSTRREAKKSAAAAAAAQPQEPHAVKTLPSKDMIGLDPFYIQLCANISMYLYNEQDTFVLDHQGYDLHDVGLTQDPEVFLFDNNGIFEPTTPPFVGVVAGTTMILAWRGSHTIMDWERDFAFHTSASFRWKNVANTVKVQGSYLSLVENHMIEHEALILETIQSRNITELVLTGHSLGGGVAQVAHLWFEGSMTQQSGVETNNKNNNPWNELAGKLTVRTLAFEAPMTTVFVKSDDEHENEKGTAFLKKIGATMWTTCYKMDFVPHVYGNLEFILDFVNTVLQEVEKEKSSFLTRHPVAMLLNKLKNFGLGAARPYLRIMEQYQHIGRILYYEDFDADPQVYVDDRDWLSLRAPADGADGAPLQFRNITYNGAKKSLQDASNDHLDLLYGLSLARPVDFG